MEPFLFWQMIRMFSPYHLSIVHFLQIIPLVAIEFIILHISKEYPALAYKMFHCIVPVLSVERGKAGACGVCKMSVGGARRDSYSRNVPGGICLAAPLANLQATVSHLY